MTESIIVLGIAGLVTGILFSVPAAGPITILIVSNGLKGKLRYCHRISYGAAFADLVYTFIAVYAFSNLYEYYKPYIPYIIGIGSILLILLGIRMYRTKIDYEHMDDTGVLKDKIRNKGGFRTGLFVNFLNPALFVGWLISSFLIISLAASIGYDTGGLSTQINNNIHDIDDQEITNQLESRKDVLENMIGQMEVDENSVNTSDEDEQISLLTLSIVFATMVALGSTIWFYYLGSFIVRKRHAFKTATINKLVNGLGVLLVISGIYFAIISIQGFLA